MGGNVIILEEAAYITLQTFLDIIAPLLIVDSVCLIAISTMGKAPSNFFTRLINSGRFFKYSFSYLCEKCKKKGISTEQCIHNIDNVPHWASEGALDKLKDIVGEDEGERYERETLGVIREDDSPNCFKRERVMALMSQPKVSIERPVRFMFVVVDPVAGTDVADKVASEFVIVTLNDDKTVVLGMEAIDVIYRTDYEARMLEHIRRVRALPRCSGAKIVLDVESGTGLEAGNIISLVQENFLNVIPIVDFRRKPGTKTSEESKLEMMNMTREMFELDNIFFHEQFVTTHKDPAKLLGKFRDQMLDYTRKVVVSNGVTTSSHIHLSGKHGGKMDDLSVTFQRAIRCAKKFLHEPKYAKYRR